MVLQGANVWEGAGPSPTVGRFGGSSSLPCLVCVPLAGLCLPAIRSLSAAFLHLWFPHSRPRLRGKEGSWRGGGRFEGKVPSPKLPFFPTTLARHCSPQQPRRGDAEKPSLLGGSSVQQKMPIPLLLCTQPVHCSRVWRLHRDVCPCTEARPCPVAACRGLPIPALSQQLAGERHSPDLRRCSPA